MALPFHTGRDGRTVLLFTRGPRREAKAKRLPGAGAKLFEQFVRAWRACASEVGAELVAVTPEESAGALEHLIPGVSLLPQEGDDFAGHVEAAFEAAFAHEASAAVIVPGDAPPPEATELRALFERLEADERAMAIAPAADGGVNLIGFAPRAERLPADIAWFSSNVCEQLRLHAERLRLPLYVGALCFDVDDMADVRALYLRSAFDSLWRRFRALLAATLNGRTAYGALGITASSEPLVAAPRDRGPPAVFAP